MKKERREGTLRTWLTVLVGTPLGIATVVASVLLVLAAMVIVPFWAIHTFHTEPLQQEFMAWADGLPVETDMPRAYRVFGRVYLEDGSSLYPETLAAESLGLELSDAHVLCIRDNVMYLALEEAEKARGVNEPWHLAALSLDTMQAEELAVLEKPAKAYMRLDPAKDYADLEAWYHDGKICLNDGQTVIEWNLATRSYATFAHEAYAFPQPAIRCRPDAEDATRATLTCNGAEAQITLAAMAERSEAAAMILARQNEVIWNGETRMLDSAFTAYSFQHDGTSLWAIVGMHAMNGETWAMFLKYDEGETRWRYAGCAHTSEKLHWNVCHVIPVVE